MRKGVFLLAAMLLLAGCSSDGTLGLVTKSTVDGRLFLKNSQSYKELGYVEGQACRYFVLGVAPWGDSAFSAAVDQALTKVGGDALINVTVSSSLYGFMPILTASSHTCTNVKGIAIKFEGESSQKAGR